MIKIRPKDVVSVAIAIIIIIGYNVFLARRDSALYEAHTERACQQMKSFHPDCQANL